MAIGIAVTEIAVIEIAATGIGSTATGTTTIGMAAVTIGTDLRTGSESYSAAVSKLRRAGSSAMPAVDFRYLWTRLILAVRPPRQIRPRSCLALTV
jgi:hypothetical protein